MRRVSLRTGEKRSFLSTYTCAASLSDTSFVQSCLQLLKGDIEKSDAMLYAPTSNDIKENCKMMSLSCYMQELMMVIEEEGVHTTEAHCIFDFYEQLRPEANFVGCPPCEAYSLKNITIFLDRLNNLLQEITTARHYNKM
ncbi:hypothetical protein L3Q82_019655 [Scortum barcoo]|uniref:Uncharacterized protein n=1 Tax=Scortum barcoo TaxID=214431 RepID=A0ACB8VCA3_9TELE|nr:hypothetical protein L3Q82_019655 [Scortum barcoo]